MRFLLPLLLFRLAITAHLPRNADDASNYLAGLEMAAGNWRLHGWIMAPDNYVPTDVLGIAVLARLFGPHPVLMVVFEALVWAAIGLVGTRLALLGVAAGHRAGVACLALAVLAAGLVTPGIDDGFVATVASHGCTILLTLLAFGVATGSGRVLLLAGLVTVGSMADPIFVVIAALPLLAVGLLRPRDRTGRRQMVAVLAGLVLGRLLLGLNAHTGGFSSSHLTLTLASFPALIDHFGFAIHALARLFGADFFGLLVNHRIVGGPYVALLRAPLLLALAVVLCEGGARVLHAVRQWPEPGMTDATRLDDLLWFGTVSCIGATVMTTAITDPDGARFFLPAMVCGGILLARSFGRQTLPALYGAAALLVSVVFCLLALPPGLPKIGDVADSDETVLLDALQDHGLTHGYGGYWQSSITTALSGRGITMLALAETPDGGLTPFDWFCNRDWYTRAHHWTGPVFVVVVRQPASALDLRGPTVSHVFGSPAQTLHAGTHDILLYPTPPNPV